MGRHSATPPRSRRTAALVAVPVVLVAGIAAGAVAIHEHNDDDKGSSSASSSAASALASCSSTTPLHVTTTPDMAPVLRSVTDRLESTGHDCVDYSVQVEPASLTASQLTGGQDTSTQVWIPDSRLWAGRVTNAHPAASLTVGADVATSPLVLAVPRTATSVPAGPLPLAQVLDQRPVPLRMADPERSTPSLLAVLAAQQVLSTDAQSTHAMQALLLSLSRSTAEESTLRSSAASGQSSTTFPSSEQQVWATDQDDPSAKMRALAAKEGLPELDYPYVTVSRGGPAPPAKGVEALKAALTDASGVEALHKAGFRTQGSQGPGVQGIPAAMPTATATPEAKQATAAMQAWVAMSQQTRLLAVIDTSESMKKQATPTLTRLQLAAGAAVNALGKFPDASQIGLWTFDLSHTGQPADWTEVVPIRPLSVNVDGSTQRQVLGKAASGLTWHQAGGTALYDTIWAAYDRLQRTYQPGYVNTLVLLTDGRNEDPDTMSEAKLRATLAAASKDSSRPIRVALIAVSQDADLGALQRIASSVPGGQAYDARNPQAIYGIMQTILTTRDIGH